jgi:hypothetical protein
MEEERVCETVFVRRLEKLRGDDLIGIDVRIGH